DFGKHVIPNALSTHRVCAHVFPGFWEDIGTVRSYYEVSMQLVSSGGPFKFYDPEHPLFTSPRHLPGSRIQEATITDSIICEGGRISKARIANSIIGIRTLIRPDVVVERSVLMGADLFEEKPEKGTVPLGIGAGSHISGAIIDKNVRIGENVVIRGDAGQENVECDEYCVVDGIVVVRRGAVIPDGTRIG
ncbi:MAG: glucose-1-phosphate adenylyltransferase, partial [bacterium]|nr:glucose-1-phosphate adenylyltransferase [bacterium]